MIYRPELDYFLRWALKVDSSKPDRWTTPWIITENLKLPTRQLFSLTRSFSFKQKSFFIFTYTSWWENIVKIILENLKTLLPHEGELFVDEVA